MSVATENTRAPSAGQVPLDESIRAEAKARMAELRTRYDGVEGVALLSAMITTEFPGRIALVSSFGAEAAVLLHMVSQIDPTTPVVFLNTGKLFPETLRYRDLLQERLGLCDLRVIAPDPRDRQRLDADGSLWRRDPDACCHFRKVLPLERALVGFDATITGRKRFQTSERAALPAIEAQPRRDGTAIRFAVNPLISWTPEALADYVRTHRLPEHPLRKEGFLSIGCMPCTERVSDGAEYRAGRWAGQDKEECGIHTPAFQEGEGI